MKSSVVYAAIWFMHVCKIWDNDLTESDRVSGLIISLYNFKQPLDISSPQIERKRSKEYLVFQKHFNTCLREWKLLSIYVSPNYFPFIDC